MSSDVFAVSPRAGIRKVAVEMAKRKLGSAIVVDQAAVVGIFTTIDVLDVLVGVLETQGRAADSSTSSKANAGKRRRRKVARAAP